MRTPIVLLVALILSSCSWWSEHKGPAKATAIACAKQEAVSDLAPAVLEILAGGSLSWRDQLEAFATKFGEDALACAVKVARSTFEQRGAQAMDGSRVTSELSRDQLGWIHAQSAIDEHGWRYAP